MATLSEKLELVEKHVSRAVAAATADAGASPVLRAVVLEFERKSSKATAAGKSAAAPARELVVELEEAGDCAKIAAEADAGAAADTRRAIIVAHDAICLLKFESKA